MGNGAWYNPMTWDGPWIWVWAALFVIVFCRAGATYLLGSAARAGIARFKPVQKLMRASVYQRAERALDRWGPPAVAATFLTVGLQTAMNLAAGVIRMRWYRYIPALVVGGAVWATIYTTIGSVSVAAIAAAYTRWPVPTVVVTVLLGLALVGWIIWRLTFVKSAQHQETQS